MEWHINDLSLNGQFAGSQQVRSILEPLLRLRLRYHYLYNNLYSSRQLGNRQATPTATLYRAIIATNDKNFISLAIQWIAKSGPFWEDFRQFHDYDYFEFDGEEVTDQGLGEAARRLLADIDSKVFSFRGLQRFELPRLTVQYGFSDDNLKPVTVDNDWLIEQLEVAVQSTREMTCWMNVHEEIIRQFGEIQFSNTVMDTLYSVPFSNAAANRIFILLRILNRLAEETLIGSGFSSIGKEIWRDNFAGAAAGNIPLFKPESQSNQREFRAELKFIDPANPEKTIFCHWHGKIQNPQIRIHFEWPRPRNQREIKVVYIGPKITKD